MIRKFKKIENFGIFNNFDWENALLDKSGHAKNFQHINILYGRNYSGKTTLSRILRGLETGELSDKFENPSFIIELADKSLVTQTTLKNHSKKIRVFNEDFVRANLRFITNPDDSIEPFAVLGDDNNKIEEEIETLQAELGSKEEGKETGLYAEKEKVTTEYEKASKQHKTADDALEEKLSDKAINRKIGIKYRSERFGDQNYNTQKLKTEIQKVEDENYLSLTDEQLLQYENLISEKMLQPISPFEAPHLNFQSLANETEALVVKKISDSDKIEELVKDAVLNRWVKDGRTYHNNKRSKCAFCNNSISEDRWKTLEKHFDEESEQLEKSIDTLITNIKKEQDTAKSALSIQKDLFYSKFHDQLDKLNRELKDALNKHEESLNQLIYQLELRKENILNQVSFQKPTDISNELLAAWGSYKSILEKSNDFTDSVDAEKKSAQEALRLKEVSDYLVTINYQDQLSSIKALKNRLDDIAKEKNRTNAEINEKEKLILSKKRELKDEENGAKKINEYLNNFFGHSFLTLEAKKENINGEELKRVRFEVIRDSKKAYHLSEGESSLLAFCYFLAKLHDVDTRDLKPIIWIDDPISSLDSNHIFFVYSLLDAEIVSVGKFEQLFVSTHNLDFLKYLKKLRGSFLAPNGKQQSYQNEYFTVVRKDKIATIEAMPQYLKEYVTEFNYLFHQILKCSEIEIVDDTNYTTFFNFGNNARKFFEIYLYYKYPDQGMNEDTLTQFFDKEKIPAILTDRINNEYSHLSGTFERGATPVEQPEILTAAKKIIASLKKNDPVQYNALLKSVGGSVITEPNTLPKSPQLVETN